MYPFQDLMYPFQEVRSTLFIIGRGTLVINFPLKVFTSDWSLRIWKAFYSCHCKIRMAIEFIKQMFCPFFLHRVECVTPNPSCSGGQICTWFMSFCRGWKVMSESFLPWYGCFQFYNILQWANPSKLPSPQMEVGVNFTHEFFYVFQYIPQVQASSSEQLRC